MEDPFYRVILPDGIPHLIKGESDEETFYGMNINEKLENDYPHLYEAIKDEKYFISNYESCYYFFEIPDDEEEIIGFATLNIHDDETLILNQIYVLPEYRGQKHFINVLNYFMDLFDEAIFYIKNPNKRILEQLEELDLLTKLDERFYLSQIFFFYDLVAFDDSLKYTNRTYIEEKGKIPHHMPCNLYDKQLNTLVSLASQNNKPYTGREKGDVKRCSMSLVRDEDEKEYDYLEKRRNDPWIQNGNYFKKAKKIVFRKLREEGLL